MRLIMKKIKKFLSKIFDVASIVSSSIAALAVMAFLCGVFIEGLAKIPCSNLSTCYAIVIFITGIIVALKIRLLDEGKRWVELVLFIAGTIFNVLFILSAFVSDCQGNEDGAIKLLNATIWADFVIVMKCLGLVVALYFKKYICYREKKLEQPKTTPYVLDYKVYNDLKIPALTRKNADFVEAVVGLDSNYNRDADVNAKPDDDFDVFQNTSSSSGKYCGSSAYWFYKMEHGGNFEECLLGAIISIDRTNSTHLESGVDGRRVIKDIILKKCKNVEKLKKELNKDFQTNPKEHLIGIMSVDLPAKKKGTNRSNLSFASKFCSYASICLNTQIEYSKYDNVVASHLKEYVEAYLNRSDIKNCEFKYDSDRKNKSQDRLHYVTNVYIRYYQLIGEIIDCLKQQHNVSISRNEFDHIVWYGFKGK